MKQQLLMVCFVLFGSFLNAQEANIKLTLTKGDKYKLEYLRTATSTEDDNNGMVYKSNVTTGQTIEVINVENGLYTLSVTNHGLLAKLINDGFEFAVNTMPNAKRFSEIKNFPDFIKHAANFTYQIVVDENGTLLKTVGIEKLAKPSDEDKIAVSSFSLATPSYYFDDGFPNVTDSSMIHFTLQSFNQLSKKLYKVGDAWEQEDITNNNVIAKYNYTVDAIKDGIVTVKKSGNNRIPTLKTNYLETSGHIEETNIITINSNTGVNSYQQKSSKGKVVVKYKKGDAIVKVESVVSLRVSKE